MEIKGYNSNCLDSSMEILGEAFNYAVYGCNLLLDDFMRLFISSGYAKQFEEGNPKIVLGITGVELVENIFNRINIIKERTDFNMDYSITPEYWCGWILAYYQWKTGLNFKFIQSHISMEEVLKLYSTLHEASEDKFVDVVNTIIKRKIKTTRLQEIRKLRGLSQVELSQQSGVNLRTLQEYELGSKNINKAAAITVFELSKVLNCSISDILELI